MSLRGAMKEAYAPDPVGKPASFIGGTGKKCPCGCRRDSSRLWRCQRRADERLGDRPLGDMKTPDGQDFGEKTAQQPVRTASSAMLSAIKGLGVALWAASMVVLRAIGKFIITTWRLAAALDSALWRGFKLLMRRLGAGLSYSGGLIAAAFHALLLWLPTRWGRAYSGACGIVLIVLSLWIADEIRNAADFAVTDRDTILRPPVDEDDPILARIDGRYVHLSEIEASARASGVLRDGENLSPETAYRRELVEAYVEQRLLASAALSDGLHRNPQVSRRYNAARDRVLASAFMEEIIGAQVTNDRIERLYASQADVARLGEEVRARHIVVETQEEAAEIAALLDGGADFSALARERSIDRVTAPLGGEIGWFTRPMLARELSNAAFATETNQRSAPVETEFGWHILEVLGRRTGAAVSLDQVRDEIEEFLRMKTIADTLRELEDDAQVVYFRPQSEIDETESVDTIMDNDPLTADPGEETLR